MSESPVSEPSIFRISPLIRLTLIGLYVALTVPLPFLAEVTEAPVPPTFLWVGIAVGFVALYGVLGERVILDEAGICLTLPGLKARGFSVRWVPT
ncbi:MAG: hypothetical protein ACP5D4_18265, partial [Baaleninema sp.]